LGLIYWNGGAKASNILLGTRVSLSFSLWFIQVPCLGKFGFPYAALDCQRIAAITGVIAGTNLIFAYPLSERLISFMDWLLFEPAAVGLFHLAPRLFQYIEIPLSALSRKFILELAGYSPIK